MVTTQFREVQHHKPHLRFRQIPAGGHQWETDLLAQIHDVSKFLEGKYQNRSSSKSTNA